MVTRMLLVAQLQMLKLPTETRVAISIIVHYKNVVSSHDNGADNHDNETPGPPAMGG